MAALFVRIQKTVTSIKGTVTMSSKGPRPTLEAFTAASHDGVLRIEWHG
ncbi:hypothetical protein [Arthrobacter sp. B0490]|nr:hypothetical protein [Arthrobacter sp. B0490]